MAYTALYRKLRPQRFSDMVGQEHIVRTLTNQITGGRISHAYLFCGIRGTGKTSAAKIFSRAVNCQNPANGEPCNECAACLEIIKERSMNVSEIDAASNNGVENVRDIIEDCYYPPTSGRYKVYIIDEVHMLSASAFNALLKTLEEPPEHVVFILATTDPQKIPATIHSRCQRFDFKRITSADIAGSLKKYAESDNVDISDEALSYIASVSDGAMRDALSLFEQCVSFYFNERITLGKVLDLLGAVDMSVYFGLTDALYAADSLRCMKIIDEIVMNGRDISQFVAGCLVHFRNILVCSAAGADSAVVEASRENIKKLCEQGEKIESNVLIHYINTFSELQGKLKYLPNERAMLEVACIKLCSPSALDSYDALFSRIRLLERYIEEGKLTLAAPPQKEEYGHESRQDRENTAEGEIKEKPDDGIRTKKHRKKQVEAPAPEIMQKIEAGWQSFASGFLPLESNLLLSASPEFKDGCLYIVFDNKIDADIFKNKSEMVEKKLSEAFGTDFQVKYTWQKKSKAPGVADTDGADLLAQVNKILNDNAEFE